MGNKILVVDDEKTVIQHVRALLDSFGYKSAYVHRAHILMKRLESELFDLILLDINMPGIDGITGLKQLKEHPVYKDIPVIMMTGDTSDKTVETCFINGAADYITKPVEELVLKARVKSVIEKQEYNREIQRRLSEIQMQKVELLSQKEILEEQKEDLLEKNKNISDSINYAKAIQNTLLPSDKDFQKYFSDNYFIYYQPKGTIGGDFYFINKVNDTIVFAVADCTGHGVPGALITMLGITFLQDIIKKNIVNSTGKVLELLRKRIKDAFKSYGKDIQNKNGMDIAVCALNTKTKIMQYSGAFSPMLIIRDNKLLDYKPTRNPIGYYPVEKKFETQDVQLQKDDYIYLFSDGYQDQTGGDQNKKFLKRKFYNLLLKINKYPIKEQKNILDKILQEWKGNNSQVDDMTVMGIKWNNYK